MRQTQAKGFRRDLRRAVGAEALKTIGEQEQAIALLGASLNSVRGDVAALARDHAVYKKTVTEGLASTLDLRDEQASAHLTRLQQRAATDLVLTSQACLAGSEVLRRGWYGRLRWLVTGQ